MKYFYVIMAITFVFTFVLCMLLGKWMFEAVLATNWPAWVKYMILR